MYKKHSVAVVIPAYNVASHIRQVLKDMPEFVDKIIVVNDCSTDETVNVVGMSDDRRIVVLSHEINKGVGGAMVTGFRSALEQEAALIVKMDGDGQMDSKYLPKLLDALTDENYAYSKGNRFLDNRKLRDMPTVRLFGNYVLTFLTKLVSGYWHVFDPQNGFVAIKADALRQIDMDRLVKRYFFENDMLIHLNIFGCRVKDVPIPARYANERSSMSILHVAFTFPYHLFRRFWYRLYEKHILRDFSPIAVFWLSGLALFSWGFCFGAYTWIKSTTLGQFASTGTVMLSVLPLVMGFELILQAMILEIKDSPK